ncbi:succinate dehydrogenase hydrophobic membrane anchor subunit [Gulosibacter molinativorax]|uniref:Succinate dehydrogenase n=1 Tax=Gulosibacter molinativorax TaxID=256821 RepID=A0ABT7C9A4_9MICO|nr:succinate dehydrogenase hydrophobic membrane anchor subunit [Gulosibacter molinativorax]MDJ1371354.1 succinate dehydrogenase [Gulosibacter molinativorax]QUY63582.1 Succinate dehydrogenase, hydrophobic anchorsubunit [Gulosibacter molinativorax]
MTIEAVEYPRTPLSERKQSGKNWERIGWSFMRISGVLLIFLVFVHLYSNLVAGDGVSQIGFEFVVAEKFSVPFWLIWDALLLVLALIHGTNGMRTIVNDYVYKPGPRKALITTLWIACIVEIVLGLIVLIVFAVEPCVQGPGSASICS